MTIAKQKEKTFQTIKAQLIADGYKWVEPKYLIHPHEPQIYMLTRKSGLKPVEYRYYIGSTKTNKKYYVMSFRGNVNTYVSRLKWETFKGEIPEGHRMKYIDNDPSNLDIDNFEVVSPQECGKHANTFREAYIKQKQVRCLETGEVFSGVPEACDKMLTRNYRTNLYAHLNKTVRKKRVKLKDGTVKKREYRVNKIMGLTFEWVEPEGTPND